MRKLSWICGLFLILSLFGVGAAQAAEFRGGEENPRITGTLNDDLYVAGNTVSISGQVNGEVVAAGREVKLSGSSTGSMFAGAEIVDLTGKVGGTARVAGRLITLDGEIDGDLMAAGQSVKISDSGSVDRDLLVGAQEVDVDGTVGGDFRGGAGSVTITGTINGDVEIDVDDLTLTKDAVIRGDLVYTSPNQADRDPGAQVSGKIVRKVRASTSDVSEPLDLFLGLLRKVAGAFILGVVVLLLLPGFLPETTAALKGGGWLASAGVGLLALFVIPAIAIFLLVITALLGAGISVPLLMIVLWAFLLILSKAIVAAALGALIVRTPKGVVPTRGKTFLALLVGVVILSLLSLIPYVGPFVDSIVVLLAMGASIIAYFRWRKRPRLLIDPAGRPVSPEPAPVPASTTTVAG